MVLLLPMLLDFFRPLLLLLLLLLLLRMVVVVLVVDHLPVVVQGICLPVRCCACCVRGKVACRREEQGVRVCMQRWAKRRTGQKQLDETSS